MAINLMWAYVRSDMTPWEESIDGNMICKYVSLTTGRYFSDVCSFSNLNEDIADYFKKSDFVVNFCYGLGDMNQVDVAKWFELKKINHTAPSSLSLALCQDKHQIPYLAETGGVFSPASVGSDSPSNIKAIAKPRFGARHRGIFTGLIDEISNQIDIESDEYVIQEFIDGREFSVAVIPDSNGYGLDVLEPMEIYSDTHGVNFFMGQNGVNTERNYCPEIGQSLKAKLLDAALNVHKISGCHAISRCDFRVKEDKIYLLEVNAMPNLHPVLSLLPRIAEECGIDNKEFIRRFLKYVTTTEKSHVIHI
ncbi:MAG TPA: ATP-grasp domain-containing protein [Candidatus Wunengus sp. YC60]|uniref:ATP-grasp domain-containing protein n=1 Tax=Candidatus Wunengus sp. YC60 TaxID=3367697 RepID=UPI00402A5C96